MGEPREKRRVESIYYSYKAEADKFFVKKGTFTAAEDKLHALHLFLPAILP